MSEASDGGDDFREPGAEAWRIVVDLVARRPSVAAVEPAEHRPLMRIELVRLSDVEELRDGHDRGERCRLELLEQLVFELCSFDCSWAARKPHHEVRAAVDPAAPHGVVRS